MRTARIRQPGLSSARSLLMRRAFAVLMAAAALGFTSASAASAPTDQITAPKSVPTIRKPAARAHKRTAAAKPSPAGSPAPEQTAPKPPDWPANDKPTEANVVWNSHGLRIDAANSSLQQILKDVSTATGAKVSGLGADQRIFGTYGPGSARDVLSELLDGSGYNVLMIGEQGQGTPRQVVLSKQPTGPAPPPSTSNNSSQGSDEGGSADVEEPQPPPQQPQSMPPGFGPGAQPRTPQQILQEMQQRQQQIEQMQQQQQQQRTNPPQ